MGMRFHEFIKNLFLVLVAFTVLGLLSMIPLDKYQRAYNKKRQEIRNAPQMHVDATERYVEAIMEGEEDVSKGIKARAPKKYYFKFFNKQVVTNKKQPKVRVHDKPVFVRDRKNPKKLIPYNKSRSW